MVDTDNKNTLFLIPVNLSETDYNWYLPSNVLKTIHTIECFIVENAKTARHFLKGIGHPLPIQQIVIFELDKHHANEQAKELESLLSTRQNIGLMSEAGLPCIADPGTHVVRLAHKMDVKVKPLTGPSSVILALIASGLNGQSFKFNGYIPSKPAERKAAIQKLETESRHTTQILIEAPYRNEQLLKDLCNTLKPETMLLLAIDITGEHEQIVCKKVSWWKQHQFETGKIPCIFAIGI